MSIQAMNTSLNNNRKQMPKRDKFKRFFGSYSTKGNKTEYNLPKATSKQLRDIRKRLQNERQIRWLKAILLTLFIFIGIVGLIVYLIENII